MGDESPRSASLKRALIVVEGQTEERFVKDVLAPTLAGSDLYLTPVVFTTKLVKDGPNFKGGLSNFTKFGGDIHRVLQGSGGCLVTTLVDYYALPIDFPGMANRPMHLPPIARVQHVESSLKQHFANHLNFFPFVALHEYEAWLFSDATTVPEMMTQPSTAQQFAAIAAMDPEDINEHPNTAPSKRLLALYPAYRKTLHGPIAAARIGLPTIRERCPHFAQWMAKLEGYAAGP